MERIKRLRMIFCRYLYSIVREKNLTIEDIVKKTDRSYTEIKRILEGLISPSLDDLLLIAEQLGIHVTLNTEIPLGHKKIERLFPQFTLKPAE
ncbi:MAG TPA: helix-turn-helix transcriptional regulator [Puia sp.]|jgi:transcriptional regulator with XRE-family HTH domain|nr:helix-turn-helix transcriptional regulator [Puia sp.]